MRAPTPSPLDEPTALGVVTLKVPGGMANEALMLSPSMPRSKGVTFRPCATSALPVRMEPPLLVEGCGAGAGAGDSSSPSSPWWELGGLGSASTAFLARARDFANRMPSFSLSLSSFNTEPVYIAAVPTFIGIADFFVMPPLWTVPRRAPPRPPTFTGAMVSVMGSSGGGGVALEALVRLLVRVGLGAALDVVAVGSSSSSSATAGEGESTNWGSMPMSPIIIPKVALSAGIGEVIIIGIVEKSKGKSIELAEGSPFMKAVKGSVLASSPESRKEKKESDVGSAELTAEVVEGNEENGAC